MAEIEVNGAIKEDIKPEDAKESSQEGTNTDDVLETSEDQKDAVSEKVETSNLEKQIIRQVEYYFGDLNLPRDAFLLEQIKLDDGWIPLEVLLKFQRLANLSKDLDVLVVALGKSTNGLLEISEDKKKIRRNPERVVPQQNEERRQKIMAQTLYCKGFPLDSTLDDLLDYYQKFGNVDSVIMRQYRDKKSKVNKFKGSVFVIFSSREKAQEFLDQEEVKYGETVLIKMWQSDYLEKKKLERKRPEKDNSQKQTQQQEEENAKSLPRGTVLNFKGNFNDMSWEELKSAIEEKGVKVAFISYSKGDEEGWVRMHEENGAKAFFENLEDNKFVTKKASFDVRVLEGEEEETFLKEAVADMTRRRLAGRQNFRGKRGGRGGGRGGRGGYHQYRKRKADNAGDGPPAKQ